MHFARSRLWLAVLLVGLAVTAVGVFFLWPRFAFLPVVLFLPPIVLGGRRRGDEPVGGKGEEAGESEDRRP